MKTMRIISVAAVALTVSAAMTLPLSRAPISEARADGPDDPVVVELFTSQSCYSCPPAEKFLGDLAGRKSVLALEFHVDYWDDLVYGSAGKWKDVFSRREYTERQRGYNRRIRGRGDVYTPQMIVDGRHEAVGSRRVPVLSAIERAESDRKDRVGVKVTLDGAAVRTVSLDGKNETSGAVWLVRYIGSRETRVRAGENKGKELLSHHIVTEVRNIGVWTGKAVEIGVHGFSLAVGEGCAVLVQDNRQGPILGAARCPMAAS